MNSLSEKLQTISCLTAAQKEFLYKRLFFSSISVIAAWGIIISSIFAWLLLFWLKPSLVNSSHILQLLTAKAITFLQLAELAVTGATAVTALFVLLVLIALMMLSFAKKEKQYLQIINLLGEKSENNH